jgi:hypothetical protein
MLIAVPFGFCAYQKRLSTILNTTAAQDVNSFMIPQLNTFIK